MNAAHAVNTIITRATPSRAKCMGHELDENAQRKRHLFNTHALDFWGCKSSLHWQAERKPTRLRTPTVPYSLPLLFIATNSSLFTPYRLTTPLATVEISMRPAQTEQACYTQ